MKDNVDVYDKLQDLKDNDINIHDFNFKSLFEDVINNNSSNMMYLSVEEVNEIFFKYWFLAHCEALQLRFQ